MVLVTDADLCSLAVPTEIGVSQSLPPFHHVEETTHHGAGLRTARLVSVATEALYPNRPCRRAAAATSVS